MHKIQQFFQHTFFQKLLTAALGRLAKSNISLIKNLFIYIFCRCYAIEMSEAVTEDPFAYATFQDFFIRRLKSSARPIDQDPCAILSPADGTISQLGYLEGASLLQAKGKYYSLRQLLAGNDTLTTCFDSGAHALIYLAPNNYHRVHMPLSGRLLQMIYVPGTLFSVSTKTAQHVDDLFARNERVIAIFDTAIGKMAVILVGAMIVGSISTVWAGIITPPRQQTVASVYEYAEQKITLEKGQELGYFSLGSTVIILFEKDQVQWHQHLHLATIQMGQSIAKMKSKYYAL